MCPLNPDSKLVLFDLNHPVQAFNYVTLRLSKYKGKTAILLTTVLGNPFIKSLVDLNYFDDVIEYDFNLTKCAKPEKIYDYFDEKLSEHGYSINDFYEIYTSADLINMFGVYLNHNCISAILMENTKNELNRGIPRSKWGALNCSFSEEYLHLQTHPDILGGVGTPFKLLRNGQSDIPLNDTDFVENYQELIRNIPDSVRDKLIMDCNFEDISDCTILFMNSEGIVADHTSYDSIFSYYIYQMILDWIIGTNVLLKQHPNDGRDIRKYFNNCKFITSPAPISFLNFKKENLSLNCHSIVSSSTSMIEKFVHKEYLFGNDLLSSVATYLPHIFISLKITSAIFRDYRNVIQRIIGRSNEHLFAKWSIDNVFNLNLNVSSTLVDKPSVFIIRESPQKIEKDSVYFLLDHSDTLWYKNLSVPTQSCVALINIKVEPKSSDFIGSVLNENIVLIAPRRYAAHIKDYKCVVDNKHANSYLSCSCILMTREGHKFISDILSYNGVAPVALRDALSRKEATHMSIRNKALVSFVKGAGLEDNLLHSILNVVSQYDLDNTSILYNKAIELSRGTNDFDIDAMLFLASFHNHLRASILFIERIYANPNSLFLPLLDTVVEQIISCNDEVIINKLSNILVVNSWNSISETICKVCYQKDFNGFFKKFYYQNKHLFHVVSNWINVGMGADNVWCRSEYMDLLWSKNDEESIQILFNVSSDFSTKGDSLATGYLGRLYYTGKGVEKDLNKATECLRVALQQHVPWAGPYFMDALMELNTPDSLLEMIAVGYYESLEGDAQCVGRLARAFRDGKGLQKNLNVAASWMKKAIDLGNGWAKWEYVDILSKINSVESHDVMFQYLVSEFKHHHPEMTARLARCYRDGKGVEKNLQKASELYDSVCNFVYPRWAKWEYFDMLWDMGEEYYPRMIDLAINSTESDNPLMIGRLAKAYREGKGVKKDLNKAAELMFKAHQKGIMWASWEYFDILYDIGSKDSLAEMIRFGNLKENESNREIAGRMCKIYLEGKGVDVDFDLAKKWYDTAVDLKNLWVEASYYNILFKKE